VRRLDFILVKLAGIRLKLIALLIGFYVICLVALPVSADVPAHKFTDVSVGALFIVALRDDGTVWTWGGLGCEKYGEGLAQRDFWVQSTPVQVPISDVISVSAGSSFSIALKEDGTVWMWGLFTNKKGDLTPVQVKNLDNVRQISAKGLHALALKNDGTVWSWGDNYGGSLGDGTFENHLDPVQVVGLSNITSIEGGNFAIKDDGTVWTWGLTILNENVKINGSLPSPLAVRDISKPLPYRIPYINNISSIDIDGGYIHAVYAKDDGTVWTWGVNAFGELGDGTAYEGMNPPYQSMPTQVKGIQNIKQVVAGTASSLALDNTGKVWAWGGNYAKQLGFDDFFETYSTPKALNITNVTKISTGNMNTAFLKNDGSIWIAGGNRCGQKGDGSISDYIGTPTKVLGPENEDIDASDQKPSNNANSNSSNLNNTHPNNSGMASNTWFSPGVVAFALVILIIGCVLYLKVLRK